MFSSETSTPGLRLLEHLIRKRLIFGGPVLSGPARFLWKNEIVDHNYGWTITFTREDLRDELIREAEKESAEAICMITFTPFDGSPVMHALLEQAFSGREKESLKRLGYFDDETCRLEPIDNPFGPKVLPPLDPAVTPCSGVHCSQIVHGDSVVQDLFTPYSRSQ